MRKTRHTESQILAIIKEADAGVALPDLCRRHNVSAATIFRWRSKYGGMELADVKRLKELESENSKLKRLVGQYAYEIEAMKELVKKKF
jgi:putative transposase